MVKCKGKNLPILIKMWNSEIFQISSWRQKVSLQMIKPDCSLFDRIMISWYIVIWIRAKKICSLFDRIMIWIRAKARFKETLVTGQFPVGDTHPPSQGYFAQLTLFASRNSPRGIFPQVTLHEKQLSARINSYLYKNV